MTTKLWNPDSTTLQWVPRMTPDGRCWGAWDRINECWHIGPSGNARKWQYGVCAQARCDELNG